MEDHDDQLHVPTTTRMTSTGGNVMSKNGLQMVYDLLAIVYHVFEEAKYMNFKPPLQPSSRLFTPLDGSSSPRSPPDSPQDDSFTHEMNGGTSSLTGASLASHGHPVHGAGGHQPVIPYTPEEIQDSYTKIAALKNQYIKISTELLEMVKYLETKQQKEVTDENPSDEHQAKDKETMEKLIQRRDQLRRDVYERNLVMQGLIDRLRHLQHSIRFMKGGSAYPPAVVMESV